MPVKIENKVLDNETLKKLAETGTLGFTENPEFLYTPKKCRSLEKTLQPIFKLKGKDGIESAKLEDNMGHMEWEDNTNKKRWVGKTGTRRVEVLTEGVKGWKNWFDREGQEIPFRENNGKISNHSLRIIPPGLATELADAIIERNTLSPEELEGLEF